MSYDPGASSETKRHSRVKPKDEEEDEDEPPAPVLPRPNSPRTLHACAKCGCTAEELVYKPLPEFDERGTLREISFVRYQAHESSRLAKLDAVLAARELLSAPAPTAQSALLAAQEAEASGALQRERERLAKLKQQQQRKAEKEVRQVLLLQASAAELAEQSRLREERETQRAAELDEEAKRQREEFNQRKQEMERLKQEEERARTAHLRQEQLQRLEREKRFIEEEERKHKARQKEIAVKQQQKAERQREHKMMIEAKEHQRELLAEKRLSQMAEKDGIRREAVAQAQEETARRNEEMREYQSLRMQSIREHQEQQLLERRREFENKQESAQFKLVAAEAVKVQERVARKIAVKEKDESRQQVFVQMKERMEDRRESFLSAHERREQKLELVQSKLNRERELKREELRIQQTGKEEMVRKARRIEEYERKLAMDRLLANEEKQAVIKQTKGQLFRERKKLQRQALIERSQTLESLEKLRTYGGQPDAALMALLGDSVVQPSASSRKDEQNRSAPRLQQIATVSTGPTLPDIRAETFDRDSEQNYDIGGSSHYDDPMLSPRDVHLVRLEDLRRQQNEELLMILHQEHEKEKERELILSVIDDGEERSRVDRLFGVERSSARRAIKKLTRAQEKELKALAVRFELESSQLVAPANLAQIQATVRVSSRQSIEALAGV